MFPEGQGHANPREIHVRWLGVVLNVTFNILFNILETELLQTISRQNEYARD